MFGFKRRAKPPVVRCSFCNKSQYRVKHLIEDPNIPARVYICNECVGVCVGILKEAEGETTPFGFKRRAKPPVVRCSFCNKSQYRAKHLIQDPNNMPTRVYICNECVAACVGILKDAKKKAPPK